LSVPVEISTSSSPTAQADRTIQIGLITVNYKSAEATARFLGDILRQDRSHCRLRVVVADNSATMDDLEPVRASFRDAEGVVFLPMPSNPGYFGAAHRAFQQIWPDGPPDWLIVANPDIRLPQEGFFNRLAQLSPSTGVVLAPRITSGRTGLDQNPYRRSRPTRFRMSLFRLIPRVWLLHWMLRAQCHVRHRLRMSTKRIVTPSTPNPEVIYAPHGSFVVFSREYFQRGNALNAGSFLFGEEIFVAESCRRAGLPVVWVPSLQVVHDEHVVVKVGAMTRKYHIEAADYLYEEFFSPATHLRGKIRPQLWD
jgi:GT2 family glycosyltransferase